MFKQSKDYGQPEQHLGNSPFAGGCRFGAPTLSPHARQILVTLKNPKILESASPARHVVARRK